MLRFFRSSNIRVIVIIILTGILTWLHVLSDSTIVPSGKYGAFMYQSLNGWLLNTQEAYVWCGFILFLLTAILLLFVNRRFRLIEKISYLPGLCYILLVGGIPDIHQFNPAVIATILLVTSFIFLAKSFEREQLSYSYFVAPMFISTATFFYQYMYVYMLVVWLSIAFWRPGYWREWVFSILGFALPLFFAFSWFFLIDDDYTRMGVFFKEIFSIQRRMVPSVSNTSIAFFALSIVIIVFAFGYLLRYLRSNKVIIRNRFGVLILLSVITAGLMIIVPDMIPLAWYLLAFPMSFILAYYLATIKSFRWGTVVLFILFMAVATAQAFFIYYHS